MIPLLVVTLIMLSYAIMYYLGYKIGYAKGIANQQEEQNNGYTYHGNTVERWKNNAKDNYTTTPISVLKYITILEEHTATLQNQLNGAESVVEMYADKIAALQEEIERLKKNLALARKVPDQVKADVDKYGDLIVELNKTKEENKRLREIAEAGKKFIGGSFYRHLVLSMSEQTANDYNRFKELVNDYNPTNPTDL